jgi:hypothetical protein
LDEVVPEKAMLPFELKAQLSPGMVRMWRTYISQILYKLGLVGSV